MNVRDAFFNKIYEKTVAGEDFMVVTSDLGAPSLDDFRRDFINRYCSVGIAEQNLLSVAAGLQLAGKQVVAYGLNPFPVTRAFDQVRNIMASMEVPITLAALNAGTCSIDAGYTHIAVENMSLLRTLRNIRIINPSDETISRRLADDIISEKMPRYVQFDKHIMGQLYQPDEIDFKKGFAVTPGNEKKVIVTYGIYANKLKQESIKNKIIDLFSLPVDEKALLSELSESESIIAVEDGVLPGGIGSMLLEILNDNNAAIPVKRVGLSCDSGYPKNCTSRDKLWESEKMSMADVLSLLK